MDWFLTRTQVYEPGKILSLGQVLLNPRNPGDALFAKATSFVTITDDYIRDRGERKNVTMQVEAKLKASFKLWGKINGAPVAAKLHGERKKETEAKWTLKRLESDMFSPDLEYVEQVLKAGDVPASTKWWKLRRRIFLVTGVRIARGAITSVSNENKSSVGGEVQGDGSSQNAFVKGGIEANREHGTKKVETSEESSDFVFAYRLHEITWIAGVDKQVYDGGDTEAVPDDDTAGLNPDALTDEDEDEDGEEEEITGYELDGLRLLSGEDDMVE
jgi:hypothetical protein